MIEAVIFDVDGVIADTEDAIAQATVNMFRELYGAGVKKEDFAPFVGTGAINYINGVAEKYKVKVNMEEAVKNREKQFERIAFSEGIDVFAGVMERIQEAKGLGWKLAIATSSHKAKLEVTLKGTGLSKELFDAITTAEECQNVKPDPELFLLTAKKLGVSPENSMVIEDSPAGIKAGKTGGFFVVGIASTFTEEKLKGADFVAESLGKISFKDLFSLFS